MSRILFILVLLPLGLHAKEIRFAIYNVQNLFDTAHDEGKFDFRYLPTRNRDRLRHCKRIEETKPPTSPSVRECRNPIDWNKSKLKMKLEQIRNVFDLRGELPDILVLSEVENKKVAKELARVLGYRGTLISESTDQRGIDLAFLFNESSSLKVIRSQQHSPKVGFGSRPIFEVEFRYRLRGRDRPLIVFANHWPSQGGKTSIPRMRAAATLRQLLDERHLSLPEADFIALGDFNVIDYDNPHPFQDELLKRTSSGLKMIDIHAQAKHQSPSSAPGSYYFAREKEWHVLDRFFVSESLMDGAAMDVDLNSYLIFGPRELSEQRAGVWAPWRYDHRAQSREEVGFSDHYPVFLNLKPESQEKI